MSERTKLAKALGVAIACGACGACGQSDEGSTGPVASGGKSAIAAPEAGAGAPGNGGAPGSGGRAATGGSAGAPTGGGGGSGSGGVSASGGSGGASGGSGGGSGGQPASGGAGGSQGTGGSGGGTVSHPVPSAGCAKMAARPSGGKVTVANDHIYDFPASYDGKTPMPLLVALHAANNPNTQLEDMTNGTRAETSFVRAFPKSAGSAWVYNTDAAKVTAVYDDLVANYCIDTSRVFATGHSSGAQMVVQLLCAPGSEKRFKAVAPVAASRYCAKVTPIAALYIQGMMDAMRGNGNGADVAGVFSSSNTCTSATTPYTAVPTCKSTFDQMAVTPGCISYQGCAAPTVWCSHDDHGYNGTDGYEHGWPCFASNAMADFFLSLP